MQSGSIIVGRFRLERLLGEGGMGSVWAATHVVTKKPMALKFLKADLGATTSAVRRFLREARAASAVRHPNVVEIHDVLELDNGLPAMVMDLLIGESLGGRLERERRIPLPDLAQIMIPVISAVGTAHAVGIVHRDLKPDNIFLERHADGSIEPKVLDFGIAKLSAVEGAAAQTADLTNTGSVMGTPYYMAPEQIFGEKDVDQRADVWAIGVILYEALAGRRPITGESFGQLLKAITMGTIVPLEQVAPGLPSEVTELVGRMLAVTRSDRPEDLREPFAVVTRYASARSLSFGPPGSASSGPVPAGASYDARAFSPTEISDRPAPGADSQSSGFSRTKGTTFIRQYGRRTLGVAAGIFTLTLGLLLVLRWPRGDEEQTPTIAGSATLKPLGSTPSVPLPPPVEPETTAARPVTTPSAPIASQPLPRAPRGRLASPLVPSARAPAASTATAVGGAASSASAVRSASPAARLPGGVASAAPF